MAKNDDAQTWWFFRIDFYLCLFLLKTVDSPEVARSALVKFVDPIFFFWGVLHVVLKSPQNLKIQQAPPKILKHLVLGSSTLTV